MNCDRGLVTISATLIVALVLGSCANKATAPISRKSQVGANEVSIHRAGQRERKSATERPRSYLVKRGDTLHSIAWRYGIDYKKLARWNRLRDPNRIFVGQRLSLRPPPVKKRQATRAKPSATARAKSVTKKRNTTPARVARRSANRRLKWTWPARGEVYPAASALGTKGIEIHGKRGAPVLAAAPGTVVYEGSGLRGYGQLIIIKHNDEYLSAYAHNDRLLVREGAKVQAGQKIAEMGDSDAKQVMLHFEIRRDGKAIEPLRHLPRR